ncbi:YbjN domain-containing protein [Corynebacterium mendelii]|uniref:YbjN domain-containing protein n=1 Tax=Corynebacterium mendelii TaxID=2765362 RepID=A0A939E2L5_9CORY|nr:hypothetical protein [Corynebacterium mendelii]MBN9644628.1 hypothetical protein [Corynebacterium mendelii]
MASPTTFCPDTDAIAARVTAAGHTVVDTGTDGEGNPTVVAATDGCLVTFTCRSALSATMAVTGTLSAAGYVAAIVAANNANTNTRGIKIAVDGDGAPLGKALGDKDAPLVLLAEQQLVTGDGVTGPQLDDFVGEVLATAAQLVDFAARLAADPDHDDPDNAPETVFVDRAATTPAARETQPDGSFPPVGRDRVAAWFAARGITDVPYDDETETVCLMMDGTPIDIIVADPATVTVKIGAQLPATGIQDPGTIIHALNHANLEFRSTVCAARADGNWWIIARHVLPQTFGMSDSQLDQLIGSGVVEVAAQLKQTLKAIRES